jgi:carboxyl-terminal processing protease
MTRSTPESRLAGAMALGLALCLAGCSAAPKAAALTPDERRLDVESFDYVWSTVRDRHFDPTLGGLDWNAVRAELRPRVERATTRDDARDVLVDLVGRFKQSHFQILPADLYEPAAAGSPETVDGTTGIDARVIDGAAVVTRVTPGSPADRAGVKPGWEVARIDKADVRRGLRERTRRYASRFDRDTVLSGALRFALAGPVDRSASIVFRDGRGATRPMTLDRVPFEGWVSRPFGHVPGVHVWIRSGRIDGRTGYVAFNAFIDPGRLMPRFNEAIASFKDADGIVIDLRGNTGGIGDMLAGMAGWFIADRGMSLGTMVTRSGSLKLAVVPRPAAFTGPVAVLIDELSMSASEVLAQGLRDAGRARIFGRRSAGAVLASVVERLPNGDGFQYPTARFEFASGTAVEGVGVVPDVEVRPTRETLLAGRDVALDAAIQWIRSGTTKGPRP